MRWAILGVTCVGVCLALACGSTDHNANTGSVGTAGDAGAAGGGNAGTAAVTLGGSSSMSGTSGSGGADAGGGGKPATGGTATGGSASGSGGVAEASKGCTGPLEELVGELCVAKMVKLPAGYSIDSTEVTRLQYATWLASAPAPDPTCTPKPTPSYEPDATCLALGNTVYADPDHTPVVCVDWCDAVAYCKGVGKRLCGKIGGGTNPYDKLADATSSQWFNACSSGGVNLYPYGNTRTAAACNGFDNPAPGRDFWPVGSEPTCQSSVDGYQGVFDLSGNVYEWEDSCQGAGDEEVCHLRGGAVVGMLECGVDLVGFKHNRGIDADGIRCCKD